MQWPRQGRLPPRQGVGSGAVYGAGQRHGAPPPHPTAPPHPPPPAHPDTPHSHPAQAVGAPLAAFLLSLDGTGGAAGWQVLCAAEGAPAIGLAYALWRCLPDSPAAAPFLTPDERVRVVARARPPSAKPGSVGARPPARGALLTAAADGHTWLIAAIAALEASAKTALMYWCPLIVAQLVESAGGGGKGRDLAAGAGGGASGPSALALATAALALPAQALALPAAPMPPASAAAALLTALPFVAATAASLACARSCQARGEQRDTGGGVAFACTLFPAPGISRHFTFLSRPPPLTHRHPLRRGCPGPSCAGSDRRRPPHACLCRPAGDRCPMGARGCAARPSCLVPGWSLRGGGGGADQCHCKRGRCSRPRHSGRAQTPRRHARPWRGLPGGRCHRGGGPCHGPARGRQAEGRGGGGRQAARARTTTTRGRPDWARGRAR